MFTFGQRLKKVRQERSFSQSYLAENIGVSVQSVSNWECDTTMPDILQIVPLASVLGVSTDFLLGNSYDEVMEREKLEQDIAKIWATYSVNTQDNNADYLAYELYSSFLRKYPLDYEIKYKCAIAIHDYLVVATVRRKFEIGKKEFTKLYLECEKLLCAICKHSQDLQLQIEARALLVQHYIVNKQWQKAEETAKELPHIGGIKQDALRTIAQEKADYSDAKETAMLSSYIKCQDYVNSLFYLAKNISDDEGSNPDDVIMAWKNMENAAKMFVSLFANTWKPEVNSYEKNPFCYLITAYASMCNDYLRFQNQEMALDCLKKATGTALELYNWGKHHRVDALVMEDIIYFVKHTIGWCHKKQPEDVVSSFTTHPQYKMCEEDINKI